MNKKAVLNLSGADCAACVYAIEHASRKIKGISDIKIDVNTHKININYDGNKKNLEGVIHIVRKLGYNAETECEE